MKSLRSAVSFEVRSVQRTSTLHPCLRSVGGDRWTSPRTTVDWLLWTAPSMPFWSHFVPEGLRTMPGVGTRNVVLVAFEDVRLLNVTGPLEVFDLANTILRSEGAVPYRAMVMSRLGGATRTACGVKIFSEGLSAADDIDIDTLLMPGGPGVHAAAADRDLVAWLVSRAPDVRRKCWVCNGTFMLAATGLLSCRRAATHWQDAERMKELYSELTVESDLIFFHEEQVWTFFFFFSSRRRHTRLQGDWSSDVCSS